MQATPFMWQPVPMMMPAAGGAPPPQYYTTSAPPPQSTGQQPAKRGSLVVPLLLIGAVFVGALMAWARSTRLRGGEEEEEEVDANDAWQEGARNDTRNLPPPSSVGELLQGAPAHAKSRSAAQQQELDQYVADKLLTYVGDDAPSNVVDISGMDLPMETFSASLAAEAKPASGKRLTDESAEVETYAKRREALFKDAASY